MSHEQSETIQDPASGKWVNVYGRRTPKAGQRLPDDGEYGTVGAAVAAARTRSATHGMKPVTDPALLAQLEGVPAGMKPVTDPALIAQLEAPEPLPTDRPEPEMSTPQHIDAKLSEYVRPVGRAIGRTARAGARGVSALPGMIANAPAAGYNMAADAIAGEGRGFRFPDQTQFGARLADFFGLPKAENPTERIAEDVASGMAGAGGMVKLGQTMAQAASPITKKIGEVLAPEVGKVSTETGIRAAIKRAITAGASGSGGAITASGTGTGAASAVREEGAGPVAQTIAGVTGALAPSAATAGTAYLTRRALRGGEAGRQRVEENIKTFEDAGAGTPSVGQATEGRINRAVESVLAKTPGSAGRVLQKAEAEAAGLGGKVDEIATSLAGRTGAAPAGRKIASGLGQFVDDFKVKSNDLYDKLDRHIPKATAVEVGNTRDALAKLNADIPGAPNLSRWFKNSKIQGIEGALKADTSGLAAAEQGMNPFQLGMLKTLPLEEAERKAMFAAFDEGRLPYEALKKLRTLVGNEISDSTIASDVPRSKWKPLYAALTKDMAAAARVAGRDAEAAFVRANNHYSAGMKRLDEVLGPVLKKGDPEDIFQAAISGTKEGATTISGVMKSLPTESRKVVAATMLRRLGKALPGKQDDLGEAFSSETFLTNWNRITPDSKRVLFATLSDQHRADLDKIAKVASNIREGSKVFANPSGTGQMVATTGGATAFAVLLATGQLGGAAAVAGGAGLANAHSRLVTNPKFVRWLAESTKVPVEQLPAQLNTLFQQSLYMKGDERKDVRAFIASARAAAASQRTQAAQGLQR